MRRFRFILMLLLCLTVVSVSAQKRDTTVYRIVEQSAEFPGGVDKFYSFISKNLHVPETKDVDDVFGRVIISFVVEKDGSLSNVIIEKRKVNPLMYKVILNMLKQSPRWQPAQQHGKVVRMRYFLPLNIDPQRND